VGEVVEGADVKRTCLKRKARMKAGTGHKRTCPVRLSREGAAAIECIHGYDSCPKCDRCTCKRKVRVRPVNPERLARRRKGTDTVEGTDGPQSDYCRAAPCFACKRDDQRCDPEHVRPRGSGGKDRDTVPLCRECHGFRHDHGVAAIDARYQVDLRAEARRLAAIYHPQRGARGA